MIHEGVKGTCIGIIDLDVPTENTIGICEIVVYSNDSSVPHFHIRSLQTDWECCMCIYEPYYFNHSRNDKLTQNQLSILDNWLNRKFITAYSDNVITNWHMIEFYWNIDTNNILTYNKPDYRFVENMKE